ncbi:MAG: 1,4-dihydroxy-2-naphthoate octaprenyltransferase [Bacteroidota bacterium]
MHFLKKWSIATRLETITLALTSTMLGSALAAWQGSFSRAVGILAPLTASLLQVVCNLANDYGDWVRGADPINKFKAPSAIQTGLVTLAQVRQSLRWLLGAVVGVGICLLYAAHLSRGGIIAFLLLGVLAVVAAITYTLGSKPYGYQGWGDVAVFTFFGLVGVGGTFYLHIKQWHSIWLLPAISYGSLVVGVLNINNLRDMATDAQVGKNTLPVCIGRNVARLYHGGLLILSIVSMLCFLHYYVSTPWPYTCLGVLPWLLRHGIAVYYHSQEPTKLNQQLPQLVLISFVFGMLLSLGLLL